MEQKLYALLGKIAKTAEHRTCLLSEFPEWNEEMQTYVLQKYGHWNGLYINGQLQMGRLLYKLLDWRFYNKSALTDADRVSIPYHCYAINPDDVLFIEQELEWDDAQGMYVGVLAETYRNVSWKLKHPKEYAELELANKQLAEAKQKQAEKQSSTGCLPVVIFVVAVFTFMCIGALLSS